MDQQNMDGAERIRYLFDRYFTEKNTPEEELELAEATLVPDNAPLIKELQQEYWIKEPDYPMSSLAAGQQADLIIKPLSTRKKAVIWMVKRVAAAGVILALGVGFYKFVAGDRTHRPDNVTTAVAYDIHPGKSGALLTLSDGTTVLLDSLKVGAELVQNGATMVLNGKQLVYRQDPDAKPEQTAYNTISTPHGRQFCLQLPDGTQVWLNSGSSIRYPTAFAHNERRVMITGEVYFEVATDSRRPFHVNVNGLMQVDVLGTSFNINAYENEQSINTTLLHGKVRVGLTTDNKHKNNIALLPGEQAQVFSLKGKPESIGNTQEKTPNTENRIHRIAKADIEKAVAWKNGFFDFNDLSLEAALRQLERWYNISITYQSGIPDVRFRGRMSREVKLSGVLKAFEDMGIRYRLEEGGKLVILP